MKRGSSLRLIECPIPPTSGEVLSAIMRLLAGAWLPRTGWLDDVHVAGAPAEVAGDGPADVFLVRRRMLLEEGVAGHQHAGCAVAALEAMLCHEPLLKRMQLAVLFQALHRHDFLVAGLDGEHRARLHRSAVHEDGAGAAVGRVAPDMGAGQPQHVPDQVDQQEARLDVSLVLLAVDRELDPHRPHLPSPARSRALRSARAVNTRTMSRLYSTDPRRSSLGWAASAQSWAARLMAASSGRVALRAASAPVALMAVRPTLVRPIPTWSQAPLAPSVSCTATAAVAKSPTLRSSLR